MLKTPPNTVPIPSTAQTANDILRRQLAADNFTQRQEHPHRLNKSDDDHGGHSDNRHRSRPGVP